MNSNYKDSDDHLLSPLLVKALQECVELGDIESFKRLCRSEIATFHLYAEGKTGDWNTFVGYIENNFPSTYPHLVTDALLEFLTDYEVRRQATRGQWTLPYALSKGAKFVMSQGDVETKVAAAIKLKTTHQKQQKVIKFQRWCMAVLIIIVVSLITTIIMNLSPKSDTDFPIQRESQQ